MTMKSAKKNISAENEYVVTNVQNTAAAKNNNVSNFRTNQVIKVAKDNFYDETDRKHNETNIEVPLSELVRLGYLEDQYYNKQYIDAHIKIHIKILNSRPYPNDNDWATKWARDVRLADQTNYIFLVSFPANPNDETHQDGKYEEYYYYIDENHAANDYSSEKMEHAGSFIIDLSDYLREENFNDALLADISFQALQTLANTNATNIAALQQNKLDKVLDKASSFLITNSSKEVNTTQKIGNVDINGKLYDNNSLATNRIVRTNANGILYGSTDIPTSVIKHSDALSGLGLGANSFQSSINEAISTKFTNLYSSTLTQYLLKSEIDSEIWGASGFLTLRNAESDANKRALKLGDYIYQNLYGNFYTKTQIDSMIARISDLTTQTLEIL